MTFTADDLNAAIETAYENLPDDEKDYGDEWFAFAEGGKYGLDTLSTPLGQVNRVDSGPDDPGDGKAIWVVVRVGNRHFRKSGYYSSWDSSSYDGELEEVEPYEKTVTDYRKV